MTEYRKETWTPNSTNPSAVVQMHTYRNDDEYHQFTVQGFGYTVIYLRSWYDRVLGWLGGPIEVRHFPTRIDAMSCDHHSFYRGRAA